MESRNSSDGEDINEYNSSDNEYVNEYNSDSDSGFSTKVLDIRVYEEDNKIKIAFDITKSSDIEDNWPQDITSLTNDISKHINDINHYATCLFVKNSFQIIKHKDETFVGSISYMNLKDSQGNYECKSIVFTLSEDPKFALQLLSCISLHYHKNYGTFQGILFKDNEKTCNPLNDFISMMERDGAYNYQTLGNGFEKTLMGQILKNIELTNNSYSNVKNSLMLMLELCQANFLLPLVRVFPIKYHVASFYKQSISKVMNLGIDEETKKKYLMDETRKLIHADNKIEASFMLNGINYYIRMNLYNLAQKSLQAEGKSIPTHIWIFWQNMEFKFNKINNQCTISVSDNEHFQLLKNAWDDYQERLVEVWKACGFNCQIKQDEDDITLVFIAESSQQLKKIGIHLTESYIKNSIYAENNWQSFFRRMSNGTSESKIPLDKEVCNVVQEYVAYNFMGKKF